MTRFSGAGRAVAAAVRPLNRSQAFQHGGYVTNDGGVRQRTVVHVVSSEIYAGGSIPGPDEINTVHADAQHQIGGPEEIKNAARAVGRQGAGVERVIARKPAAGLDLGDDGDVGPGHYMGELPGDGGRSGFETKHSDRLRRLRQPLLYFTKLQRDGRRGRTAIGRYVWLIRGWECGDLSSAPTGGAAPGMPLVAAAPGGGKDGAHVVGGNAGTVLDGWGHGARDVEHLVPLAGGFVRRYHRR